MSSPEDKAQKILDAIDRESERFSLSDFISFLEELQNGVDVRLTAAQEDAENEEV